MTLKKKQIEEIVVALENLKDAHEKIKFLEFGKCNKRKCERDALEGYDRCAYHQAVDERNRYENLKDAGKVGAVIAAAPYIGKKAYDLGKGVLRVIG